jgi:hypothetical protein
MRKKYIEDTKFLSEDFVATEIYVRSTNVNRTIESAIAHLTGMYPNGMVSLNLNKD